MTVKKPMSGRQMQARDAYGQALDDAHCHQWSGAGEPNAKWVHDPLLAPGVRDESQEEDLLSLAKTGRYPKLLPALAECAAADREVGQEMVLEIAAIVADARQKQGGALDTVGSGILGDALSVERLAQAFLGLASSEVYRIGLANQAWDAYHAALAQVRPLVAELRHLHD
jgi:hypothetical protein